MTSIKNYVSLINKYDRVIALVDMDCFYCQVEEKLDKSLAGQPIAVVQYNEWKGGGIIAVNYVARAKGVTRHMRGDEAKEHCPEIQLVKVPVVRGKADLTKYREAGKEVAAVLQSFTPLLERASIDEAYLDITERVNARLKEMNEGRFKLDATKFISTYAVGYESIGDFVHDITSRVVDANTIEYSQQFENESEHEMTARKKSDLRLLIGASVVSEIRTAVKVKTGYDCSAGIAHNKILAKLTAGMNKPCKQTLLPLRSIPGFFNTLPIGKVKGLGGKFGEQVCQTFKVKHMADLVPIPKEELVKRFEERQGNWLYLMSRGIDLECVTPRYTTKSIGCCKRFPGANAITGAATLNHWLGELASEICERLDKDQLENNRTAKQMTISYSQTIGREDVASSRSVALNHYEPEPIAQEALEVLKRNIQPFYRPGKDGVLNNPIKFLGISVGKFEDNVDTSKKAKVMQMFDNHKVKEPPKVDKESPKVAEKKIDTFKFNPSKVLQPSLMPNKNLEAQPTTLEEIMARKKAPQVEASEPKPNPNPNPEKKSNLLAIFESLRKAREEKEKAEALERAQKAQEAQETQESRVAEELQRVKEAVKTSTNPPVENKTSLAFLNEFFFNKKDVKQIPASPKPSTSKDTHITPPPPQSVEPQTIEQEDEDLFDADTDVDEPPQLPETSIRKFNLTPPVEVEPNLSPDLTLMEPLASDITIAQPVVKKVSSSDPSFLGISGSSTQNATRSPERTVTDPNCSSKTHSSPEKSIADLEAQFCDDSNDAHPVPSPPLQSKPQSGPSSSYFMDNPDISASEILPPMLITCEVCNKKVPIDDIVSHKDYHVAKQIAQEERESFRKSFSERINRSTIFQSKSNKAKQQKLVEKGMRPLEAFLKKLEQESTSNGDTTETYRCDECFKYIKVTDRAEHLDYHVAKRLQREMNKVPVTVLGGSSGGSTQPPAKRKRVPSVGEKGKLPSSSNAVPLTRFFEKSE